MWRVYDVGVILVAIVISYTPEETRRVPPRHEVGKPNTRFKPKFRPGFQVLVQRPEDRAQQELSNGKIFFHGVSKC